MIEKELSTFFTGRNLIKLQTTESTNRYLTGLCFKSSLPEGTIVVTGFQSAGQGQAGTSWYSEEGKNLLMSILLKPDFLSPRKIFLLSKMVSLAIKDFLLEYGIASKIKWPNDLYIGEKKICGVLIENSMRGSQLQQSIIGIGLNINQEKFPPEIPNAASMKSFSGKEFSVDECLISLCNHFEKSYFELKAGHDDQINDDYLKSLYLFGEMHSYETKNEKFRAAIMNVEDDGRIVMKKEDHSIQKFGFKEIKAL